MNAKRMGMLASLAFTMALLGGMMASAASCVPTTGGPGGAGGTFCPISSNPYFISTYNGAVQNGIFSAGALSDFGAFLSANLINFLILGIVLVIAYAIFDRFYAKK